MGRVSKMFVVFVKFAGGLSIAMISVGSEFEFELIVSTVFSGVSSVSHRVRLSFRHAVW